MSDIDKLFTGTCDFVVAAAEPAQFPDTTLPEVAFIGRSNVGKSSLINALVRRKNMARASNTPGRTQQIVFFNLTNRLMLADLPGYGFAQAPLQNKKRWENLVHTYLRKRTPLKNIGLLIDARHGAMPHDIEMMQRLDRAATLYRIIVTKVDKVTASDATHVQEQLTRLAQQHPAAYPNILMTSTQKRTGLDELRQLIADLTANPDR